ncbi:MAG: 3-deoxy-7-phosphoheptulonate synthase [Deltaproteobacteria bacterium]|nr:3-deoxy-7-phosphoheptulonate synthase [Deltaproteobacteria bacterium]
MSAIPLCGDGGPVLALAGTGTQRAVVSVGTVAVGGTGFTVVAGPCAVENAEQLSLSAASVRASGAHVLRGGAFKPRTSPYAFQGLGRDGLALLQDAGRRHGMPVVAEVVDAAQVAEMAERVDLLQVGARNMQNFTLLKELGQARRPVLLKRGLSATVREWLLAAEYVLAGGNERVILCERGIRTFETGTRFTLDLSSVALVKQQCHLPVIVDPSHATGMRELVTPMALAAAAAGADGIMVEVHHDPAHALCDGPQALTPAMFEELMVRLAPVVSAVGRTLAAGRPARDAVGVTEDA